MNDVITELANEANDKAAEIARLKADNAKLRELVEDMLDYIEIREAFGRPPTSERCKEFAQRADELGVEVNDG